MSTKALLRLAALLTVAAPPFAAIAQNNPVRLTDDVLEASALGVPIDPSTRVDPATMPRDIGRRTLEPLGLTEDQLATERASGTLEVYYTSVVQDEGRWVFWGEELPKAAPRAGSELQLTVRTQNGVRYLVDFVIDSAEQPFAVVSGDARTTETAERGHLALIVTGTGREHKVRVLPLGDASFKSRRFTLFRVTVTPII
jgi:hypothetical protein